MMCSRRAQLSSASDAGIFSIKSIPSLFEKVTTMSSALRLAALVRAAIVAAALLSPAVLAGCAQPTDNGTYYLGENEQVPAALCAAWAAC